MTKMYLSSVGIPHVDRFRSLFDDSTINLVVIANGKDYHPAKLRSQKAQNACEELAELGIRARLIDLRQYSISEKLLNTLKLFDGIWLTGGNTFCLRSAMLLSHFDDLARKLLKRGLVLAGESAGAIVVGPTLNHVSQFDDPNLADIYSDRGLALIDRPIFPHADNDAVDSAIKRMSVNDNQFIALKDGEALLVTGGDLTILPIASG